MAGESYVCPQCKTRFESSASKPRCPSCRRRATRALPPLPSSISSRASSRIPDAALEGPAFVEKEPDEGPPVELAAFTSMLSFLPIVAGLGLSNPGVFFLGLLLPSSACTSALVLACLYCLKNRELFAAPFPGGIKSATYGHRHRREAERAGLGLQGYQLDPAVSDETSIRSDINHDGRQGKRAWVRIQPLIYAFTDKDTRLACSACGMWYSSNCLPCISRLRFGILLLCASMIAVLSWGHIGTPVPAFGLAYGVSVLPLMWLLEKTQPLSNSWLEGLLSSLAVVALFPAWILPYFFLAAIGIVFSALFLAG